MNPRWTHRPVDLAQRAEAEAAADWAATQVEAAGEGKILLVNNSGFGSYGEFPAPGAQTHADMVGVNVAAPVVLTSRLLPLLRERGGAILNVASTAAFQPTPFMATYGATKAFLLHWSLGLAQELKGADVRVLALCPGPTKTGFFQRAGFDESQGAGIPTMSAEAVADKALRALARGKSVTVPGIANRLLASLSSPIPKTVQAAVSAVVLRKLRLEPHENH